MDADAISPLPTELIRELKQLKTRRKHRFLLLRLDDDTNQLVVDTVTPLSASLDDLLSVLPASDCRLAVFDRAFAASSSPELVFITWIPQDAPLDVKNAYIQAKHAALVVLEAVVEVDAACKLQVERGAGISNTESDASTVDLSSPVCFMSSMAF